MNSESKIVAFHEAGHAIAALNFGQPVKDIRISPNPGTVRGNSTKDDENRIILLAGIVAASLLESGFQAKYDWDLVKNYGGDKDLENASKYKCYNGFLSIEEALERAWDLLYKNRTPLIRLADELEQKKQLSEDEVVSLTSDIQKCPLPDVLDDEVFEKMIKQDKRRV